MKTLLTTLNAKYTHTSLALNSLTAYAVRRGWDVEQREYTINQPRYRVVQELCTVSPDILGMSLYIWNVEPSLSILSDFHSVLPETVLILGGPEASSGRLAALPRELRARAILVRGEGEETLCQVLKALNRVSSGYWEAGEWSDEAVANLQAVGGISFTAKRKVIRTREREALDMETLAFPYQNGGLSRREGKIYYYEASRGCPFRCGYCLSSLEKTLRFKPISMVLDELSSFLEAGVRRVKFVDRTFNSSKSFAMRIWEFLIERDNQVTNFHFEASGDLLDEEMLELLETARPGLFQLEIGIQSTKEDTLAAVNRRTDLRHSFRAIRRILEWDNIHVHLDLIAGLPLETYQDFQRSFNDVYALQPHQLQLGFLKLLRGTKLDKERERWGMKASAAAPYEVLETDSMPFADFYKLKAVENVVEQYYNRGQFRNSLAYMQMFFPSAFALYDALGEYWEERTAGCLQVGFTEYYTIFRDCMARFLTEEEREHLDWLLRLDLYSRDKAKSLPVWMKGLDMKRDYEEEIRRFYRRLPSRAGLRGPVKPADPRAHLEILPFGPDGRGGRTAVLLLYQRRDLWGNAKQMWISWEEFAYNDEENGTHHTESEGGVPGRAVRAEF